MQANMNCRRGELKWENRARVFKRTCIMTIKSILLRWKPLTMAKSMRSKREKRLRAIKREIVEPFYQKKDEAKLVAQEAALAALKLLVRVPASTSMEVVTPSDNGATSTTPTNNMDMEMADASQIHGKNSLKPVGVIGKRLEKKLKLGRRKNSGKGKIRGQHNL